MVYSSYRADLSGLRSEMSLAQFLVTYGDAQTFANALASQITAAWKRSNPLLVVDGTTIGNVKYRLKLSVWRWRLDVKVEIVVGRFSSTTASAAWSRGGSSCSLPR